MDVSGVVPHAGLSQCVEETLELFVDIAERSVGRDPDLERDASGERASRLAAEREDVRELRH